MSKKVGTVEYETNLKKVKDLPINVSKFVALLQHVQDEKKITKENYIDSQKELVTFSCERNDDELLIQVDKLKAKNLNLKKHLEEIEANFHTISEELISSINVQNLASMDKENEKISCKKDEIVILQQENNAAVLEFEEKEKQLQPGIQLLKEQSNKAQTEKQRALRERLALENEQLQQYVNEMKTLRNEKFTLRNTLNSLRPEKQKAVDLARELNEVKRKIQELKRGKVTEDPNLNQPYTISFALPQVTIENSSASLPTFENQGLDKYKPLDVTKTDVRNTEATKQTTGVPVAVEARRKIIFPSLLQLNANKKIRLTRKEDCLHIVDI